MKSRIRKLDAVLIQVTADRYLTAESIPAAGNIHFVLFIVARLNEHRDVKSCFVNGAYDAHFISEVRKAYDDPLYSVRVFFK